MTRLKLLTPDDLTTDQREVYDALTGGERSKNATLTQPDGSLVGPFNALLYSPLTGGRFQALGEALRFHNHLPDNELEVAILVVGAHWQADFEWWAHARLARRAGVSEPVIEAIRKGERPEFENEGEALVYRVASELHNTQQLSDETYALAVDHLGEAGLADLLMLMAYYTGVSMLLNSFRVPLPGNAPSPFSDLQ